MIMSRDRSARDAPAQPETMAELIQLLNHRWWCERERAERLELELRRLKESRTFRLCAWLRGLLRLGRPVAPESVPPAPHRGHPISLTAPPVAGRISIVIPFKDRVELLHNCLRSLRRSSDRRREVILVDNGSTEAVTRRFLDCLRGRRRLRILACPGEFNFAWLCNQGARHARGDWLLFLNNDTEVIAPDWLEQLRHAAAQPGVGVVGATLLYPSGTLQHAGMFSLADGRWEHAWRGFPADHAGAAGELRQVRSVAAVTGACLLIGRGLFAELGGFDERFPHTHNDTDLCERVRRRGLLVVVTPHARLFHLESSSRGERC
jgi:O-antigen biosynthesis protein